MKRTIFILICFSSLVLQTQKLSKSKENLNKLKQRSYSSENSSSITNDDDDESFSEFLTYKFIVQPLRYLFVTSTYGLLIESPWKQEAKHAYIQLKKHPYADNSRDEYNSNMELSNTRSKLYVTTHFVYDGIKFSEIS